jgi:hypothetical protein
MGIFDPMTIGNSAMTGVLQFNIGPAFWGMLLGALSATGVAIVLSGYRLRRQPRIARPRLAPVPRVATGAGRGN